MGEGGDWGRRYVLDAPMLERALAARPAKALDVGCGEGRFCRMLRERRIKAVGIEPTIALLDRARAKDPEGVYLEGRGEDLSQFEEASFDLVISYLTLIDIADAGAAINEMARVLKPGGVLLVAHLNGFTTAGEPQRWRMTAPLGRSIPTYDDYLDVASKRVRWKGIDIVNWHRPLSWYFARFLAAGLTLDAFLEPEPAADAPAERAAKYRRAPHYCLFQWTKGRHLSQPSSFSGLGETGRRAL